MGERVKVLPSSVDAAQAMARGSVDVGDFVGRTLVVDEGPDAYRKNFEPGDRQLLADETCAASAARRPRGNALQHGKVTRGRERAAAPTSRVRSGHVARTRGGCRVVRACDADPRREPAYAAARRSYR